MSTAPMLCYVPTPQGKKKCGLTIHVYINCLQKILNLDVIGNILDLEIPINKANKFLSLDFNSM